MAPLPDPRPRLDADAVAELHRLTAARSHAEGRSEISAVYLAMFNNPDAARRVAALGEQVRFGGALPDRLREIAILRYSARNGLAYASAHHQHPAVLAGLSSELIAALAGDAVPDGLDAVERAAVLAVDEVSAHQEIATPVQRVLAEAIGDAGVVELVVLCGLYALMGYMTTAFAIAVEPGIGPGASPQGDVPGHASEIV